MGVEIATIATCDVESLTVQEKTDAFNKLIDLTLKLEETRRWNQMVKRLGFAGHERKVDAQVAVESRLQTIEESLAKNVQGLLMGNDEMKQQGIALAKDVLGLECNDLATTRTAIATFCSSDSQTDDEDTVLNLERDDEDTAVITTGITARPTKLALRRYADTLQHTATLETKFARLCGDVGIQDADDMNALNKQYIYEHYAMLNRKRKRYGCGVEIVNFTQTQSGLKACALNIWKSSWMAKYANYSMERNMWNCGISIQVSDVHTGEHELFVGIPPCIPHDFQTNPLSRQIFGGSKLYSFTPSGIMHQLQMRYDVQPPGGEEARSELATVQKQDLPDPPDADIEDDDEYRQLRKEFHEKISELRSAMWEYSLSKIGSGKEGPFEKLFMASVDRWRNELTVLAQHDLTKLQQIHDDTSMPMTMLTDGVPLVRMTTPQRTILNGFRGASRKNS